jgi:NAD(P)-dependent dehydrogenase (short-subunit alcohol dehydrogenase family)
MAGKRREPVAIVAGVGPGLGAALVRKLAEEGCGVGTFARSPQFISNLAAQLGSQSLAVPTDISDPKQVAVGFRKVQDKLGPVEILIAHASGSLDEGVPGARAQKVCRNRREQTANPQRHVPGVCRANPTNAVRQRRFGRTTSIKVEIQLTSRQWNRGTEPTQATQISSENVSCNQSDSPRRFCFGRKLCLNDQS